MQSIFLNVREHWYKEIRLTSQELGLTTRVHRHGWHRVHVRFSNVLDDDGDIVVPSTDRFIVRGSHETSILIHERDRIDRTQMLVVRLYNLSLS